MLSKPRKSIPALTLPSRFVSLAREADARRRGWWRVLACTAFLLLAPASGSHAQIQTCPGDCNDSGEVNGTELRVAIAAVFEAETLASCTAADADGDGEVRASDLVAIVAGLVEPPDGCIGFRPESAWIELAQMPSAGRQEVGVAAVGETIYVFGGIDGFRRTVATVEAYSIPDDEWRAVESLPRALHHIGAAAIDGLVYSVGGLTAAFVPVSDFFAYDPLLDEWTSLPPLPSPQGAQAVAALGGRIHSVGGGSFTSVTTHQAYDPATGQWTELAPLPSARNHLAAAAIGGFLYVAGGRFDGGGINNTGELDRYDPETDTWEVLAPMPTPRSGLAAAVVNDHLVALGGEVNPGSPQGVFDEVEIYDPASDTWTSLAPMVAPRHGIGAVTIGGLVHVPGGSPMAGFETTNRNDALEIRF